MVPCIISVVALFAVCVVVKLFDDDIRSSRYGKYVVVWVTLISLATLIISFINLLIGG